MLIDIGANLSHDSFDQDRDEVLDRAKKAGVEKIIITGSCLDSVPYAQALAQKHPGFLYSTAGIHPHQAGEVNEDALKTLGTAAIKEEVVATGEMGLDFFRDFCPRHVQEKAFQMQLEWASKIGKPLFLHQRDAHQRFLPMLKEQLDHLPAVVVHCFTGSAEELKDYLDLDLHIGITGWICDERRGKHLWEIVGDIPANRLMIETDAPYLLPRTISPKPESRRNEPAYLPEIIKKLSAVTGRSYTQIATETATTAANFFSIS